jgi:hypothetical protein
LHATTGVQRLVVVVLSGNVVLILWGTRVVPAIVSWGGLATTMATIGMQVAIAILALVGPMALRRHQSSIAIAVVCGVLFAVCYDGILLSDYMPRSTVDVNIWLLFIGAASLSGLIAGVHTGRFGQGVFAACWALVLGTALWSLGLMLINYAFWGTHQWYLFWLNDGAIDDFHRSGGTDLQLFLLQDMQGALFFHPLLSAGLGTLCGLATSGVAQLVLRLRRKPVLGVTR